MSQDGLTSGSAEPGHPRHRGLQAQNHPAAVRAELTNETRAPPDTTQPAEL
jgi:hypothetical protein